MKMNLINKAIIIIELWAILFLSLVTTAVYAENIEPVDLLTIEAAWKLALEHSPSLIAYRKQISIDNENVRQAGLLPNPELELEIAKFASGYKAAENTIMLSQEIQLGKKRNKRIQIAESLKKITLLELESLKQDILAETTAALIQVAFWQDMVVLTEELAQLNEQMYQAVKDKVEAGAVSYLEQIKAETAFEQSKLELKKAQGSLNASRIKLSSNWGNEKPNFQKVLWDLQDINLAPPLKELAKALTNNPDAIRPFTNMVLKEANLELMKAQRYPNLAIGVGGNYFNESDEVTSIIRVSLPIPILDRNQGNIAAARYDWSKAHAEQRMVETRISTELNQQYQSLQTALDEIITLKESILPSAEKAFISAQEGYEEGKFEYLDVLDAQRTFFETRSQYLQALKEYHLIKSSIDRLTGAYSLGENKNKENKLPGGNDEKSYQ